ncbi:MAG: LysR family substrate-binding domain-containing protein [Catenulispora sp.]|nr:LysR family substrate-binding domain-containing protein [Catenulispora sp.]
MTGAQESPTFRLAYVPGVTPAKWVQTWIERLPDVPLDLVPVEPGDAERTVTDGEADAALLRLPVDRTVLAAIPLYTETTVVVVPKDHEVTAVEEVEPADLDDYIVLRPLDDTLHWEALPGQPAIERPATTADAIELVAAGIGVLPVPQSLARLHHRRDLTYRPMTEDAAQSTVALSWLEGQTTDLVEEFIGIVRGRTVNSSRGRAQPTPKATSDSASKPASAKQKRQPATGGKPAPGRRQGSKPAKPRRRK